MFLHGQKQTLKEKRILIYGRNFLHYTHDSTSSLNRPTIKKRLCPSHSPSKVLSDYINNSRFLIMAWQKNIHITFVQFLCAQCVAYRYKNLEEVEDYAM